MADKPIPRLRIRLRPTAESIVRKGHPWVYAESIRQQNREGSTGELAIIYDRKDKFLAIGLYDASSPLRIRILHQGKPQTVDDDWWQARIIKCLNDRTPLFGDETTGFRLINGESDGWPGLVLDRYGRVAVLKLYTAAWVPLLENLQAWIAIHTGCESIVLRLSRNIQSELKGAGITDGMTLHGERIDHPIQFQENGLTFEADVVAGQKTGFFLDQRDNRQRVRRLARGSSVLNAFSFSGGFSVSAAAGGAKEVTDIDISLHALESAKRNFSLNAASISGECRHETIKADAFDWLDESKREFDVVILDPPSLARREAERSRAIQAYGKLARNGARLLRNGGTLVTASCSAHVSSDEFYQTVCTAVGRPFKELMRDEHAKDHPATFKEAQYLKCLFLQLG